VARPDLRKIVPVELTVHGIVELVHERASGLPRVGASAGQALPPAHLGPVPPVVAVPVNVHLLARSCADDYVRAARLGIRSVRSPQYVRDHPRGCLLAEKLLRPRDRLREQ